MPARKHSVKKRSQKVRETKPDSPSKSVKPKVPTPDFHHKFLVDEGSGNNSPLYYLLIFFTLALMVAAIYSGVDSYYRMSLRRIDNFDKCIAHPLSTVMEINPRVCSTKDGRNFLERISVPLPDPVSQDAPSSTLTLPGGWVVESYGYDKQFGAAIRIVPISLSDTINLETSPEVVLGGEKVYFLDGNVCEPDTCGYYSSDSLEFNNTDYMVEIYTDQSSIPSTTRYTFQFEVEDKYGNFFVSANYYNNDQLVSIRELLGKINIDEVGKVFDNLYMDF